MCFLGLGKVAWILEALGSRSDKAAKYPDLGQEEARVQILVLASEEEGHFSDECRELVLKLAHHRAQAQPPALRGSWFAVLHRRLWGILSMALQRAVGMSLLQTAARPAGLVCADKQVEDGYWKIRCSRRR